MDVLDLPELMSFMMQVHATLRDGIGLDHLALNVYLSRRRTLLEKVSVTL